MNSFLQPAPGRIQTDIVLSLYSSCVCMSLLKALIGNSAGTSTYYHIPGADQIVVKKN